MTRTKADQVARGSTKHAGGAPTKYKPEYCEALIEFMRIDEHTETIELARTNSKGEQWLEQKRIPTLIKFIEDFAWEVVGTTPQTLLEWAKDYPEFGKAYARARHFQKKHLLQCGFAGVSDSTMTKFAAVNLTDMRDKQDMTSDGRAIAPVVHITLATGEGVV